MTDNGESAELSWAWGMTGASPTMRYSVEPTGLEAGTSLDPDNLKAGPAFYERLKVESLIYPV